MESRASMNGTILRVYCRRSKATQPVEHPLKENEKPLKVYCRRNRTTIQIDYIVPEGVPIVPDIVPEIADVVPVVPVVMDVAPAVADAVPVIAEVAGDEFVEVSLDGVVYRRVMVNERLVGGRRFYHGRVVKNQACKKIWLQAESDSDVSD